MTDLAKVLKFGRAIGGPGQRAFRALLRTKMLKIDAHLRAAIAYLADRKSRIRLSNSVTGNGHRDPKEHVSP